MIALGNAGLMGSHGAGGMSPEVISTEIDKIQTALGNKSLSDQYAVKP